jgi:SnoaL-like domain
MGNPMVSETVFMPALSRYSWAYDEDRFDLFTDVLTDDAEFVGIFKDGSSYGHVKGRQAIVAYLKSIRAAQSDQRRHYVTSLMVLEQTPTTAKTACYVMVTATTDTARIAATGTCEDEWVLEGDGKWRISRRVNLLDCQF